MTDGDALLTREPSGREQVDNRQPALTPRQRVVTYMTRSLANDLDRGTVAEQHTAALLRLCADAVERGYSAELVRAGRKWAAAREVEP